MAEERKGFFRRLAEGLTKTRNNIVTSNIRAHLPSGAVVTTPRSDVMYIVTEWGAADLHNQPLETRICAMIRIAHPRFRCALAQEAVAWGQLSPECAAQFDTQPEPEEEETT